jgi:carbon starvation protein
MLNSFILTTLDTATRIGRYLTTELFKLKNRYLSTTIIVFFGGWLGLSGKWNKIWPAFGAANQLIAALALMVVTCWLLSRKKTTRYTLIPSIFMALTTVGALIFQMSQCIRDKDWLLLTIAGILICLAISIFLEAIIVVRKRWLSLS